MPEHRGRLVAVLSRHLAPKRDLISARHDNPRFAWGEGRQESNRAWRAPKSVSTGQFILDVENDRRLPYDATFYLGARNAATAWRVMDKVKDRQNRLAGTALALPDDQKRARVEVTLGRTELWRRGIHKVADLIEHDWATMQGDYFGFYLPTFVAEDRMNIADRHWEPQRLQRFLNVGLVGLDAMERQRGVDRKAARLGLVRHLRSVGRRPPMARRVGQGAAGTSIAYAELNDRIRTALRTMSDRERLLLNQAEAERTGAI